MLILVKDLFPKASKQACSHFQVLNSGGNTHANIDPKACPSLRAAFRNGIKECFQRKTSGGYIDIETERSPTHALEGKLFLLVTLQSCIPSFWSVPCIWTRNSIMKGNSDMELCKPRKRMRQNFNWKQHTKRWSLITPVQVLFVWILARAKIRYILGVYTIMLTVSGWLLHIMRFSIWSIDASQFDTTYLLRLCVVFEFQRVFQRCPCTTELEVSSLSFQNCIKRCLHRKNCQRKSFLAHLLAWSCFRWRK